MTRWRPPIALTRKEEFLLKRLSRTKKLFAFLRLHRHELFDDGFQEELETMYRQTGAGTAPLPPAMLCMVLLLQAYTGTSDAEAVELAIVDARWQLVLDCMNSEAPLVSQGALQQFRERLIAAGLDRRLLERTVELAKDSKEFDWKKLPKEVRVAVDSRPLEGAGRVEDTINLLGHAARKIVRLATLLTGTLIEVVAHEARIPIALYGSTKAALDLHLVDRGYINSTLVDEVQAQGDEMLCKPWRVRNIRPKLFKKTDFKLNMRDKTITCPNGQVENFEPGHVVEFDPEACGPCPLRSQCTLSASGKGRTVTIAEDEQLQKKLRRLQGPLRAASNCVTSSAWSIVLHTWPRDKGREPATTA